MESFFDLMSRIRSNPVDLTLTLKNGWPGVHFEPANTLERDGWNARMLHLYSHCGTHVDAPYHFGVSDQTIEQYDPASFMGAAWVIRLNRPAPRQVITPEDLGDIKDIFKPGESLLIQTNWSGLVGITAYRDELPRIGMELALWCVEHQVKMLGVEPPSVADVNNLEEVTRIHQVLLGGKVIIVEGLTCLDQLTTRKVFFMALPLKIEKGDGAPARAIAFELNQEE